MQRNMSYRKPVPAYIPSPPPSPSMHLSSELEGPAPPLPCDWREVIEALVEQRSSSYSMEGMFSRRTENGSDPLTVDNYGEYQGVAAGDGVTENAMISPPTSPAKRQRRKLHQHYRPPTPPLPTHYRKRRLVESEAFYTVTSCDLESCRTPRLSCYTQHSPRTGRELSMMAASFSTFRTKSFSFKEKTYSPFGNSKPSTSSLGGVTTCAGSDTGFHDLPVLPMHIGRSPKHRQRASDKETPTRLVGSSWWERMVSWGAFLRTKVTGLATFLTAC